MDSTEISLHTDHLHFFLGLIAEKPRGSFGPNSELFAVICLKYRLKLKYKSINGTTVGQDFFLPLLFREKEFPTMTCVLTYLFPHR